MNEMTATTQLAVVRLTLNDARREALFASGLQPSDAPTADMVIEAINCTIQQFGIHGCTGRMAQEFGDHPDVAATRMRWVRGLAPQAGAWAPASLGGELPGLEPERGSAHVGGGDRAGSQAMPGPGLDDQEAIKHQETTHERDM